MNEKKRYGKPSDNGHYSVWIITIIYEARDIKVLDFFDVSCKYIFPDNYKIFQANLFKKEDENIKAEKLTIVGKSPVRKRLTTLLNEMNAVAKKYEVHFEDFNIVDISYYYSPLPYEKTTCNDTLVASSNKQAEYSGSDLRVLDLAENRYEWQNKLLNLFYDEEKEVFVKPDDRTIHLVQDSSGSVGKSPYVRINKYSPTQLTKLQ